MSRRVRHETFNAKLTHAPLVIVCSRESEFPQFGKAKEKYLLTLVREFEHHDRAVGEAQSQRTSKADKIKDLLEGFGVISIYDHEKDELLRFFIDNKAPSSEEVLAAIGDEHRSLVKSATIEEAVLTIRIPITAETNLKEAYKKAQRFAGNINGYCEGEPAMEEEVDKQTLQRLCEEAGIEFPESLFRKTNNLRRYPNPKFKPGL